MSVRIPWLVAGALLASPGVAHAGTAPTVWSFAGIGASQRTVRLVSQVGGCDRIATPVVTETPTSVRILALVVTPDPSPEPIACPAILGFAPQSVTLAAPLAGRSLLGATAGAGFAAPEAAVPRVVGLSPGDAVTVLRAARVTPVVTRRGGGSGLRRVLAQRGGRLVVGR